MAGITDSMSLRDYQIQADQEIDAAYAAGHRNVLLVMPTGAGKTVSVAHRIKKHSGASVFIAHRSELLGQASRTMAARGIRHRIIAPDSTIKHIIQSQIRLLGRDFYDPSSQCAVAGVDTLISPSRQTGLKRWADQVSLWITDEAAHIVFENKWGKALKMFPNAIGLGVTATPLRSDGKGLGRHADGPFDCMVIGPNMRSLIDRGYLTDYRIFCPPSNLDLTDVPTGSDGDYVRKQLSLKTRSSDIMGHVVDSYLKIAPGKLGLTFAPDVETATEFSKMFNDAGVPAEVLTGKTPDQLRVEVMRRFEAGAIKQLVSCDLFGEGLDIPAVEVVSMARATESYGLYVQQFGRAVRLQDGKLKAIIIDHVSNVLRHGLPDAPREWTLDRRERRSSRPKDDVIPMRVCLNPVCLAPYERVLLACPFCGTIPVPQGRSTPEMVDGDLYELDPAVLAQMRGAVQAVDRHPDEVLRAMQRAGHGYPVAKGAANQHEARQRAQTVLREAMALWGGYQQAMGRSMSEAQRRWWHRYGVDVLSAQALGRPDAEALTAKVTADICKLDEDLRCR